MRLSVLVVNGLVLGGVALLAFAAGAEVQAAELLPRSAVDGVLPEVSALETRAAREAGPSDFAALAGAYLDRAQPGLATAALEHAPREVQERPEVAQQYARALFHRGHARAALAVARKAEAACEDAAECAPWVLAKTSRQVAFFEQVVAAGIDDPQADPDGTRAAYERSAREVHLVAMR